MRPALVHAARSELSRFGVAAAAAAATLILIAPSWVGAASDWITPGASRVDDRLVVVAFDDRDTGSERLLTIAHRRGVYLRDLSVIAARAGASAIIYVGFDSLTLREGPADRSAIADSDRIQQLGIAPLLDVAMDNAATPPRADRYRVDELADQFAGLGLPLTVDTPVVRSCPEVALTSTLDPGTLVRAPVRGQQPTGLLLGLAVRALALALPGSAPTATADSITMAPATIPLENGRLRIHWSDQIGAPQARRVVPAASVLGPSPPAPGEWAGKIVVIGTTDPAQTPYVDTPVGALPELTIQANVLNTMLTGEYLRPVPELVSTLAAALSALTVVLAWRRRWWWGATAAGLLAAGWAGVAVVLAAHGWLVDAVRPAAAALLAGAILVGAFLVRQVLERRRLARLFGQYVPQGVARDLVDSGRAKVAQAGERLLVTVLFCDLRGFTPIAARLAPTDIRALLDWYYETFSRIVFNHGGTVLQYTGDEIFAVFGAPMPRTDHADAALKCAKAMQAALPGHNSTQIAAGLPEIAFGIGLHSGLVVAAHVGSTIRRQYSIIGGPVNVGSRLCNQAREHEIVWSSAVQDQLIQPETTPTDGDVTLKGIDAPVSIHRLRSEPDVSPKPSR